MKVYARPPWAKPKPPPKGMLERQPNSAKMGGAAGMALILFMIVLYRADIETQVRI